MKTSAICELAEAETENTYGSQRMIAMISSVIAKLNFESPAYEQTLKQLASHAALEVGELVDDRNLPITIDSQSNDETEQITRWIQNLEGVEFVDVVFVYLES